MRRTVIYGDQALFVRRTLFQEIGGFPNQPILEDAAVCEQLIKKISSLILSPPVVSDARKLWLGPEPSTDMEGSADNLSAESGSVSIHPSSLSYAQAGQPATVTIPSASHPPSILLIRS